MAEIREAFAMEQEQPQVPVLKECAVKQVDVTVPKTDDPDMPVLTFRMWFLGITTCVMLSFVNQFFWYRSEPLSVSSIAAQIAVVPVGHLMAKYITKRVFFQGSRLEFTMNPGPFNIKEHVLITIFANAGAGTVYATHILSAVKLLYKRPLGFLPAFLVMVTTQFLGFGWAGIFRKYLVEPGEMWWPSNLVQVSLFRALHETEPRLKGGTSRTQFFVITLLCSFAYYVIPGYLFLMVGSISWVCWIAPKSVTVQQVGSGLQGLGLGSFAFDWVGIASYLGSPLASPWFATANIAVGYVFIMYVVTPICYWFNVYNAKTFPIYSSKLFTLRGAKYPISEIVNSKFELDRKVYGELGPLNLSTFFAMSYGLGFAALSSTVVHIMLFHGSDMWNQTKKAFSGKNMDIHSWLMKKYNPVPGWWFHIILGVTISITIFTCEHYIETLQLPWWGVLLACAIAIFFTLPIGIIAATTNQAPGLNVITEYIIGYLYPERPVANILFKVYGYISMTQALTFVSDFKLGHYMKIPPKSMFLAQVIGTLISVLVYVLTAWWLMTTIPHLCDVSMLPENSPWKCPMDNVFYSASVIWGLVGPRRIFGDLGEYSNVNWFFLVGAIGPVLVFIAARAMPDVKWIRLIHIPLIFNATGMMPPASSINFNSWLVFAFLSGFVLYRYRFNWWQRYNYVLSGGLDAGTAFMTLLLFACLQSKDISLSWWGNDPEGCPLAKCPTAAGVFVQGCPVY